MNSNPFPASFLNFKGTFKLSRVYIPGNQTFMVSPRCFMMQVASDQMLLPCPQSPYGKVDKPADRPHRRHGRQAAWVTIL